jgi:diketogulonate reductase-like aldo/keto reductase
MGLAKSIGLSNFDIPGIKDVMEIAEVPVSVNQVEFHPYLYQEELLNFCKEKGIVLTAYSPLARGEIAADRIITEVAEKHGKTPAQVSLRWLLQHGTVVIPKSSSESHLRENMDIFDWGLLKNDMEKIDKIEKQKRLINPFFMKVPFFGNLMDKLH